MKEPKLAHMYFQVLRTFSDIGAPAIAPSLAMAVVFKMAAMQYYQYPNFLANAKKLASEMITVRTTLLHGSHFCNKKKIWLH